MSLLPFSLLLLISLLLLAPSTADLSSDLISLRSQSPSAVIRLNDALLSRILSSPTPRPFSLLIFFDALNLHSKPDLNLKSLHNEFSLLSLSYLSNNPHSPNDLFFFDIEFSQSQPSFAKFGVNSLPHIRLVTAAATSSNLGSQSVKMGAADYTQLADSMAQFVESKTKLTVGPIHRPPLLSNTQLGIIITLIMISSPFLIKKLILGDTLLHDRRVWLGGAVFIYFFSVSGAMFNVIRKSPMFMGDRNDPEKIVFFYAGSGMQLGAEGFAVGSLYTVFGLLLAFVTHVLTKVRNVNVQRGVMFGALLVSFWAVNKVVFLDNWKTGYAIHMYWPSSWQ